jgi:hypothetical protein
MTHEAIAQRRAELQSQLQQEQANKDNASRLVDTINGALQDCAFWEQKLAEQEAAPTERPRLELVEHDESFVEQGA